MQIGNTEVFGFNAALRAQRNPMDSWVKSDSVWNLWGSKEQEEREDQFGIVTDAPAEIGPEDWALFTKLGKNGTEHRKALRMIQVWATMILPRYVLTEFDTYKVGVTRLSCSTMHKLGHKDLDSSDFAYNDVLPETLETLNRLGKEYREGGKKDYDLVRKMKRYLPEGFLQRGDFNLNYETAINMFRQRKNHRLEEWRYTNGTGTSICDWISRLPYMKNLLIAIGEIKDVAI